MTPPLPLQDRTSRIAYMASALVDRFGADAARVADRQRLLSADDIAKTWEDIRSHITGLLPDIGLDV